MGVGYALNRYGLETDEVKPEDLQVGQAQSPLDAFANAGANAELAQVDPARISAPAGSTTIPGVNTNPLPPTFLPAEPPGQPMPLVGPTPGLPPAPVPAMAPTKPKPAGGGGGGTQAEKTLRGDLDRVNAEQEKLARQKGDVGTLRADIEAFNARQDEQVRKDAQLREQQVTQAAEAAIARKQADADAEDQKYRKMSPLGFFQSRGADGKVRTDTGRSILAYVGMALGAAGATLSKGPNYAMEMLDRAIDRDYQSQRDNILKQKDVVTMARQGVEAARQAKVDKLLDLERWRARAYDAVAAQGKSLLAKQGVNEAEWDKNALVAGAHAKALESRQAFDKNLAEMEHMRASTSLMRAQAAEARSKAAAGPAGKLSEGQAAAAGMLGNLIESVQTIKRLPDLSEKDLAQIQTNDSLMHLTDNPKGVLGTGVAIAARSAGAPKNRFEGLSDPAKQAALEWDKAQNLVTYILTGKGMNIEEARTKARQMAPQPGEGQQMLAYKKQALESFIQNEMVLTGGAAPMLANKMASAPAAPAAQPDIVRLKDKRTGQMINARRGPDGKYYPVQ